MDKQSFTGSPLIHWSSLLLVGMLAGCSSPTPEKVDNVCDIFTQYPRWYWAAQASESHWGVPIATQMAIIHQESHFKPFAAPPRNRFLWFIPTTRPTSAYGYAQVIDETWGNYQSHTHHGGRRDDFESSIDFIGWYGSQAVAEAGVSLKNPSALYLAYHEGLGGYTSKSYRTKPWLVTVAKKVAARATLYQQQLLACQAGLPKKPWWLFWS